MSTLLSLFILHACVVTSASFQNLTDTQVAPAWVPNPSGRGSSEIIYGCASTLVLCVWNSVHLNIPAVREDGWVTYRRKVKWVMIALLAPEVLVFTAFQQWLAARKFLREFECIHSDRPTENPEYLSRKQDFNLSYAMYVVMGGFAVDISMLHNTLEIATITTNGLLLIVRRGFDIYMDRELIPDKSKVDLLAKALVILQIVGVVGQFIERKVEKLPISVLEYHTVVHVVCAIVMYALWFRKPYDVRSPKVLSHGEWFNELAYMVASSNWAGRSGFEEESISSKRSKWLTRYSRPRDPSFVWFGNMFKLPQILSDNPIPGTSPLERSCPHVRTHWLRGILPPRENWVIGQHGIPEPPLNVPYYPATKVEKIFVPAKGLEPLFFVETGQALATGFGPYGALADEDAAEPSYRGCRVGISHNDLRRLEGAGSLFREIIQPSERSPLSPSLTDEKKTESFALVSNSFSGNVFRIAGPPLICHRARNWTGLDDLFDCLCPGSGWFWLTLFAASSISGVYGGAHLIPSIYFPFYFPTVVEVILWKASCLLLLTCTGISLFCGVTYGLIFGSRSLESLYTKHQTRKKVELLRPQDILDQILKVLCWVGLGVFVCLSLIARAFIVVESFISLRHVPAGVYQTPDLSFISWIPHLS